MGRKDNKYIKKTKFLSNDGGLFALGRPIDFFDFMTRIALALTLFTGIVGCFWQFMKNVPTETAIYYGIDLGASFFFAWLIAQELDPDRRFGGIIGGLLSVIAMFFFGEGNPLVLLWLLFILRLLNRSSGAQHKIGDNVLILVCAYWLGKEGFWLYPVFTGLAYVVESQIKDGYFRS